MFLVGCEYQSDKEFFRNVEPTDSASVNVVLNPSDSVIYLAGVRGFSYLAVTDSLKCYNVSVFVDTTLISDKDTEYGYFNLDANDYVDGNYVLTIVATTSSGSGSLADILGAEGFLFAFTWDLIVDKSPPTAVQITDIYNDDGILRIEWEKYDKGNFGWYEVIKTVFSSTGIPSSKSIGDVLNINQNYFLDDTYLGGKVQYQVRVLNPRYISATSAAKTFIDDTLSLHAEWLEEDKVKLTWTKIKYHKALKKLNIYQNGMTVFSTNSADTNFFIGNIGIFGDKTLYKLAIFDQKATDWAKIYAEVRHSIGIPMLIHKTFIKNNVNATVYLAQDTRLYRYNTDTRKLEDSVSFTYAYTNFAVSPNNDILIASDPARKINPNNLSISEPLDVYCENIGSFSSDGKGIARVTTYWTLYDFINLKQVQAFAGVQLRDINYLSEDNQFLFELDITNLICHKIVGNQLIKQWEMQVSSFSLIPGEPEKIIILKDKICEVRNLETNQILSSFAVNSYWIRGVDATNKTVLFGLSIPNDRVVVYNYETGQKLKDIACKSYNGINYFRGSIYSSQGYEMPILNLGK